MLEGEQIYLRKMVNSDTDNIVKWRNTDSVRSRFIYQGTFTRESHQEWIRTMVDTGKVVQMIICEKETDRPVGSAYIRDIDREHEKGEYGLFIGESVSRGKGIGREVTALMLQYAFETLHLHRIYSRVLEDNIISLKSAYRGGLEKEGFCKDDVFVNGEYKSVVLLGKLNPGIRQ
ncbi:MAG: GNAT family protein [Lachnospiraceae bacterium]|nr:GNAT family protein [Lachnospiraceae bacterium]